MSAPAVFCTVALARRIEAAEVRLSEALGRAAVVLGHPRSFVEPFAGGVAVSGGAASALTKVIGIGFAGVPAEADLDRLEARYRDAGVPLVFEIATLADLACVRVLEARGLRLLRTETVLGRALVGREAPPTLAAGVSLVQVEQDDEGRRAWARVSIEGFAASEAPEGRDAAAEVHARAAIEQACGAFAAMSDGVRYVARRAGVPAAAASMRLDGDRVAQCCGAATLPSHRRHGLQTALLQQRLTDAAAAGCDVAIVTTEPGSRSQANCQRHGFVPLYARLVLGLPDSNA